MRGLDKKQFGEQNFTEVDAAIAGLNTRPITFATSTVVKIVGCPHLDVFDQNRLIPLDINLHIKLIPVTEICMQVGSVCCWCGA